ncbi:PREDICTED: plakophilin-1-like [Cyprinodon variegatus]|uniref:Plakophilin 1b n=1 Tax=Cyprinodon variegatus TaxID=28743 RepID=A0A3Q2D3E9_CYPVA|nr:PREDICTED: plakophilin-1-like [Cyprinodon variegatus]
MSKMSKADPLKSAISIENVDDTSLALPSGNQYRSGEQRVKAQVQTVRRIKSRHSSNSSRSGSTSMSPTSPVYDSVFTDGVKTPSHTSNGSAFYSNGFSKSFTIDKNISNHQSITNLGSTVRKKSVTSGYRFERTQPTAGSTVALGHANTSRSEPGVAWGRYGTQLSVPHTRNPTTEQQASRNNYRNQRSTSNHFVQRTISQSQPLYPANGFGLTHKQSQYKGSQPNMSKTPTQQTTTDSSSKTKINSGSNGNILNADITMKEAVQFLTSDDENYQNCGASYIQHNTFISDKAKEEVLKLKGIHPLVGLLHSHNSQVKHTASAALRNLSFKSDKNKEEIHRCDGITEVANQLRDSESVDLDKQLTGLLWNLSSADNLKPDLLKHALPVLMEHVILPYTTRSGDTIRDPDVFLHTTGCLRNLSSAKESSRQTMRKCRGLIDSLTAYIKDCLEKEKTNDECLENCVGILHNLTFRLEDEAPMLFTNINTLARSQLRSTSPNNSNPVGCFSSQTKLPQVERPFDFAVIEDPQPKGPSLLIHSKTLQDYLSLLSLSTGEELQEACCGTLHNLTAREGIVSSVISQIIVQKLNGMQVIAPLINSKKVNLQKTTLALVGNLIKNPNLHQAVGRKALPELLSLLAEGTSGANESDDNLAMACNATSCLVLKDLDMTKRYLGTNFIKSLSNISQNMYFPKSSKAAAVLLVKIWSDKELQSFFKKQGLTKSLFVNDTTMAAHRSLHIVD